MDPIIGKLKTPQECKNLENNATKNGRLDIARDARKRGIELKALDYGAESVAERECIEAVFAYERVLSAKKGKNTRASRTWDMIKRRGILPAVERLVSRQDETAGYKALVEMDLQDYAFEAVVLRYPDLFSKDAVEHSKARTAQTGDGKLDINERCRFHPLL